MTKIEWTDRTWNPTTGCNKVSPGCKNCYAEKMHKRMQGIEAARVSNSPPSQGGAGGGSLKYTKPFLAGVEMHEDELTKPLHWKKPQRIFVNSMSDLFHEDVPFEFIENVFQVMAECSHHTFQILTKRPDKMMRVLNEMIWSTPENILPNVWLGVSCENQQTADERIPLLLQTPAAVRFLSCEPLLGTIDLSEVTYEGQLYNPLTGVGDLSPSSNGAKVDWVIAGGESGSNARPMHPDWARSLRDQCQAAGVPFFFKQWGNNIPTYRDASGEVHFRRVQKSAAGHLLDGVAHHAFPTTQKLQEA